MVNVHVAFLADHQSLASSCRHVLYPLGLFPLALYLQVAKSADVVDLNVFCSAAHLALVREESFEQLVAFRPVSFGLTIYEDCLPFPLKGYATELCHKRGFPSSR